MIKERERECADPVSLINRRGSPSNSAERSRGYARYGTLIEYNWYRQPDVYGQRKERQRQD